MKTVRITSAAMAGLAVQAAFWLAFRGFDSVPAALLVVFGMFGALVLGAISIKQGTGKVGFALGGVQLAMCVLATLFLFSVAG